MAEKKSFSLADVIRGSVGEASIAALDAVPNSDTDAERERIVYLPRTSLVADERNFYSMDGIEELARNIELVGLLDPLRVRPMDGEDALYQVVSGHRRRAALDWLALHGCDRFESVPCIVDRTQGISKAMEELRLIYANNDTRRMSSADLAKQAERVESLLYQLKEEGFEFPGRMRDHVAEACNASKTKLAMLKVIRERLLPAWLEQWEHGTLNDACADALAHATQAVQLAAWDVIGGKPDQWREWGLRNMLACDTAALAESHGCGDHCLNVKGKMRKNDWFCRNGCCKDCDHLGSCVYACANAGDEKDALAEKYQKGKEARRAEDERLRAEREAEEAEKKANAKRHWKCFGAAVKAAGMETRDALKLIDFICPTDDDVATAEKAFCGEELNTDGCSEFDDDPFEYIEAPDFIKIADKLGCSLDRMCGRESYAADAAPQWHAGYPSRRGLYWCLFRLEDQRFHIQAYYDNVLQRFEHKNGVKIDGQLIGWVPLPDDEED